MQPEDYPFCLIYVPCPTLEVAETLGVSAVERKLAACANILPGMRSVYRWQGVIKQDEDVVLILKTRAALAQQLSAHVEEHHPYAVPAIVALPFMAGSEKFAAWLKEETGE